MIDLGSEHVRNKLHEARRECDTRLRGFRQKHVDLVRDYVGNHYGDDSAKWSKRRYIIVNLMFQAADTSQFLVVANRPRCNVNTRLSGLRAFAQHSKITLNGLIEDIHLEEALAEAWLNAFFGMGVMKVFMGDSGEVELEENVYADPGSPFAKSLSLDDFGWDVAAKSWPQVRFAYDYYRVSLDVVRADDSFDAKVRKQVVDQARRDSAEDSGHERLEDLGMDRIDDESDLGETVELVDYWLARDNRIATFARGQETKPLKVVDCTLRTGPYELLGLAMVPDRVMPTSPGMQLKESHDLVASLVRKLARQARRQKNVPVFEPLGEQDALALKGSDDGIWTMVRHLDKIGVFKQGGPDQVNLAFALQMIQQFKESAGNLDAQAGLGPQAPTASQDEMIAGQVGKKIAKWQYRFTRFAGRVCTKLFQLLFADEYSWRSNTVEYADSGVFLPSDLPRGEGGAAWSPDDREGEPDDYQVEVEPYSMPYQSPSQRLGKLLEAVSFLERMRPDIQAAGGQIDVQQLVEDFADLLDLPRLRQIISFVGPPVQQQGGESRQSPHTVRENIRRNVSSQGTPAGQSTQVQQGLLAGAGAGAQEGLGGMEGLLG